MSNLFSDDAPTDPMVMRHAKQRGSGVEPRVRRRGSYGALRGLTNALLRDRDVAAVTVTEHIVRGAPACSSGAAWSPADGAVSRDGPSATA